jgi:hypothetical protein
MKRDLLLILIIIAGLAATTLLTRWNDAHAAEPQFAEDPLYLNGPAMKRLTLSFNGVAADWYWMKSLQYLGGKIVNYEDTHGGRFNLRNLSSLNLKLLPSMLKMSTTLDPQFMEPYYHGALILPEVDPNAAIDLLNQGIAANPNEWRLRHYLGYIYWQRHDYARASAVYADGGRLPGAPAWMAAMGARMKAEGGATLAAREMYAHIYETSDDPNVKRMVEKQLQRLDALDDREKIRHVLSEFAARNARCPASWKEISPALKAAGLRLDESGTPLDPTNVGYRLVHKTCDADLDGSSSVPAL